MAVYDNSIGTLILYVYCFLQCLQNWNSLIAQHLEQMVFTNWKHTGQRYYNFCSNACIDNDILLIIQHQIYISNLIVDLKGLEIWDILITNWFMTISETLISLLCTERFIYYLSNNKHLEHISVKQDIHNSSSKKMVSFDQMIWVIASLNDPLHLS